MQSHIVIVVPAAVDVSVVVGTAVDITICVVSEVSVTIVTVDVAWARVKGILVLMNNL